MRARAALGGMGRRQAPAALILAGIVGIVNAAANARDLDAGGAQVDQYGLRLPSLTSATVFAAGTVTT